MARNSSMEPSESNGPESRAAQRTTKFFEKLLQATADGILVTDTAQNVILANEAFCALFGRTSREVIETNLFVWLEQLSGNAPQHWAELEKRVSIEEICRDVEFTTKDKTLSVTASLINDVSEGTSRSIISIWHDVTQRKNLAKFPSENPYPVLRIAKDSAVLFANSAAQPLLDGGDVGQAAPDYWKKLSSGVLKSGKVKKNVEIEHEDKILSFTAVPVPEGNYVNLYGLDVTERNGAEKALLDQRNEAQNYLDVAGVMLLAIDANQVVTLINKKGCEILGYDENEILGKNWFDNFLPTRIRADVKKVAAQLLAGDVEPVEHYENPILTKSGEERLIAWHNRVLRDEKGKIVAHLSSGEDITERKRAEEQVKNLAKFPAENPYPVLRIAGDGTVLFANSAAQPLLEERDVGQATPDYWKKLSADVLKSGEVKKHVEIEREGRILSFTGVPVPEGDYVNLYGLDVTERKRAEKALVVSELRYRTLFEQSPDAVLIIDPQTAKATEFNDVAPRQLGYTRDEFADLTVSDYEAIETPAEVKAHMKKVLQSGSDIFETRHRTKSGEIKDVLVRGKRIQLGGYTAFLVIYRDITAKKRARALSNALNEINNDINSTLDFDQIMQNVVIEATEAIGAEACGMLLRERDVWSLNHVYGPWKDLVGSKFRDEEVSHLKLAAQTKRPIVVQDALNDKRVNRERMAGFGVRSLLTIPLMVKEETFGVIVFTYHSEPVAFTDPEIDFAEKLGVALSLAIQNARSHEMIKQSLADTKALRRMSAHFTQTLELDDILETGLGEVINAFGVEHGVIYFFDQTGNLVIKRQRQLSTEFLEARTTVPADDGCAGRAIATKTVFAPTPEEHNYICEYSKILLGLDCLVAVPIVAKGNVLGVLELFAPVHRRLSDRERSIVMTMADQLASAIENANLYSKERNIANTLQETLLTVPEKIEGISFGHLYRSATAEAAKAGGDFYDLFELEHDKVGIVIGDVSGKGLKAAALTSLVKNTVKAYAYQHFSPAKVIAMTNDVIVKTSDPSSFVTLFFGILDKESGVLLYCNAGHPQPIIRRKLSAAPLLKTGGTVIGMFKDIEYKDFEETLRGDDILFLYTDGAIEARRDRELFGEERLVSLIKDLHSTEARELPQRVFDKLFDFAQGTMADDTALLAISLAKEASA